VTTACFTCFIGVVGVDAVILAETLAADAGAVAPLLRWNPDNMAQGENSSIQIKSAFSRSSKPVVGGNGSFLARVVVVRVVVGGAVEHTGGRIDLVQVVARVSEAREGTVIEVAVV
jgi:hypothetical protein